MIYKSAYLLYNKYRFDDAARPVPGWSSPWTRAPEAE